jgi:polyadenylate-binding protein
MISDAPPGMQKQMIAERIFPLISRHYPEMDNSALLVLIDQPDDLKAKAEEAMAIFASYR